MRIRKLQIQCDVIIHLFSGSGRGIIIITKSFTKKIYFIANIFFPSGYCVINYRTTFTEINSGSLYPRSNQGKGSAGLTIRAPGVARLATTVHSATSLGQLRTSDYGATGYHQLLFITEVFWFLLRYDIT